MGNQLDNFFGSAVNMVLPGMVKPALPGMSLSGSYGGTGGWHIDFDENSAHTQCATLSSQPRDYTIDIKNNLAVVTIQSEPKDIVLSLKPDGTLMGTGPLTVKGYLIVSGGGGSYSAGEGHWDSHTTTTTHEYTPLEASSSTVQQNPTLQQNGLTYTTTRNSTTTTYTPGTPSYSGPSLQYTPKTASCTQAILVSQGALKSDPAQKAANNLLFGGKPTTPAPAGLRMRGTYIAQDGFSVEFYPESAVIGCGQAARAYPYVVKAIGSQAAVKIGDPEHPLLLAIKADGELDPGQGRHEVHGRSIMGRNPNGDFTFTPLNATCYLAVLAAVVTRRRGPREARRGFHRTPSRLPWSAPSTRPTVPHSVKQRRPDRPPLPP